MKKHAIADGTPFSQEERSLSHPDKPTEAPDSEKKRSCIAFF